MIADSPGSDPLVSVVIPTHNRCDRLQLTLRSARAQRDVNYEIVVVDDGSQDDTFSMVTALADLRIRVVRNEIPRGESGARNRGVEEARGAWIAFLDDDDLWAPTKLARQLQAVRQSERQWVYAGYVAVDPQLRVLHGAPPPAPPEVMRLLQRHNSVPGSASSVMVHSGLLSRVGPFDTTLRRTADWDMWLRLARMGEPAWVCEPLVALGLHPGNTSRDMKAMFRELDVLSDRHGIRVDRARHYRWAAWTSLVEGRTRGAIRFYAGAVAAGNVRSIARALVALFGPRAVAQSTQVDDWALQARMWLDALSPRDA